MIGKKIISNKAVPLFEVKEILAERNEKGELTYEQNLTYGYSKKFSKISKSKGAKLLDELKNIEGIDEKLAVKLVDILPKDLEDLNLVIPKGIKIEEDKLQEILKTIKKFK